LIPEPNLTSCIFSFLFHLESQAGAKTKAGGRWGKLHREGSIRSVSPQASLVEKMATAARVVNKLIKGTALKKVMTVLHKILRFLPTVKQYTKVILKLDILFHLNQLNSMPLFKVSK
jgi:hypothetical protein